MRAVNTYRPATGTCATTPPSIRVVSSDSGYGAPVGVNTDDGIVPPCRCSHIAPPVANSERPVPSLQNTRGRTIALEYPARSAQPSSSTSFCCCQCPPTSSVPLQRSVNGCAANSVASVPPRLVRFTSASRTGSLAGRREIRSTTPPRDPAPYSADATPLITSTCPRSVGGICSKPRPPTSVPNSGSPSERNRV